MVDCSTSFPSHLLGGHFTHKKHRTPDPRRSAPASRSSGIEKGPHKHLSMASSQEVQEIIALGVNS